MDSHVVYRRIRDRLHYLPPVGSASHLQGSLRHGEVNSNRASTRRPRLSEKRDSDTLGGKPASAFVLGESRPATSDASNAAASGAVSPINAGATPGTNSRDAANNPAATACTSITADGTAPANQLAKFTASCQIHQSLIFDNGTNVGIGNTSPAAKLDVTGNATVRGTLTLPSLGTATSSVGFNSNPLDALASAYNSGSKAAVSQHFRWQAAGEQQHAVTLGQAEPAICLGSEYANRDRALD